MYRLRIYISPDSFMDVRKQKYSGASFLFEINAPLVQARFRVQIASRKKYQVTHFA